MRFPFVKRKDYEEVVDKLEYLLFEASGGILSQHTHPLETMYDAVRAYTQFCCDGAVEEKTRELKAEIERLEELCAHFESRVGVLNISNAKLEENYRRACAQRDARKLKAEEKLHPYKLHYGNLRMEIAREVCDRLTDTADLTQLGSFNYAWLISQENIDNLLKEMEKESK